ncbi:energy transducer TonB [Massilia agilis]|uniref:Energy transducer TonB n=1 Tax=Massilia agilis TaxID=1811226 RepID=A0ABT2DDA1_9BURK|nr:energy transducer TonB [Massilia agilis]MCS0809293.1 energy transducer TonB [Massilia agilis]
MHFSHLNNGTGSKATKMAVVAGLHVLVATVFIHSINTRHIKLPTVPEDIMVMLQPEVPPPPPPPEPPRPMPRVAPPELVVPRVEVETPPPQDPPPMQATTQADPVPAEPAPAQQAEAPPAQPSQNAGAMRTAVMADGCATPQYPATSLRNGDTGTTTLALLIGADGRVQQSRIEHSSGHRELDRAAVNALSLCKFKAAMNGGQAEAGWAQIAYDWKLE